MKLSLKIVILVGVGLFFLTSKNLLLQDSINAETSKSTSVVTTTSSVDTKQSMSNTEVIIKASYQKPLSLKDKKTILLQGVSEGEEYLEVTVKGEIFEFEQVELLWDESTNDLKEKAIVNKIKQLNNQTLVIKTVLVEGIPMEKIRWKSKNGKVYEYLIQASGDESSSVTSFKIN